MTAQAQFWATAWMERKACEPGFTELELADQRAICGHCPVVEDCLAWALEQEPRTDKDIATHAGRSGRELVDAARERRRLLNRRTAATIADVRVLLAAGEPAVEIARRLGASVGAMDRLLSRHAPELAPQFAAATRGPLKAGLK